MNVLLKIGVLAAIVAAVQSACCPQPENKGRCGECCPDACCCMCDDVVVNPGSTGSPVEVCPMQGLDIAFVVDSSSSIRLSGWIKIVDFLADFVGQLGSIGTDVRVAMVRFFDFDADLVWNLAGEETYNLTMLQDAFRSIVYKRSFTNTAAGLHMVTTQVFSGSPGDRPDDTHPNIAFMIGDGYTNEDIDLLPLRAEELQNATEHVYAIATSEFPNYPELNLIADGQNNASVFFIPVLGNDTVEQQRLVDIMMQDIRETHCFFVPNTPSPPQVVQHCKCCCPPYPMRPEPMCGCPVPPSRRRR